jgi:ABC-type uncharacterized transport system permease subunit
LDILKKANEKLTAVKPLNDCFLKFASQLDSRLNEYFSDVIVLFLIHGDVYVKNAKYTKDIEIYIESLGVNFGTNQILKA